MNFANLVVRASLLSLGIFENRLLSSIYCISLTITMFVSVSGSVIGFLNSTNAIDKLESFTAISPQLSVLLIFLDITASRSQLLDLLAIVKGNEDHVTNVVDRVNLPIKRKMTRLMVIMVAQLATFTIPVLVVSLQKDSIDDKYTFIVPYWFSCGDRISKNWLQSVCWKVKTKEVLFAINMSQMGGVIMLNTIYFAAFSLYMITVEELASHVECIKSRLMSLNGQIHQTELAFFKVKSDGQCTTLQMLHEKRIHQEFILIYNYQQFLNRGNRCVLQTVLMWKGFVTFFYINFGINTTLFIFVIFYEGNDEKIMSLKLILLGFMLFLMGFIAAGYAQSVSHMKEEIFNELCNVPWYKTNIEFRKIYLSMLAMNHTRTPVKIADMYEVHLNSFGRMVKAAYSMCNMLLLKFVK